MKNAHITCLDYSIDMLGQARKRLGSHAHIKCIQGDVGNLQMENESVDTVVSMNGFHAFPDKQKAFHEIWRVLKPGGNFIHIQISSHSLHIAVFSSLVISNFFYILP